MKRFQNFIALEKNLMLDSVTRIFVLFLLLAQFGHGKNPLPVPELEDLLQPWIFTRASEASTLFIEKDFKGREPYGNLFQLSEEVWVWAEYDGEFTQLWKILSHEKDEKQLVLMLQPLAEPEAEPSKLVVFPYWDIDHCLVMIRFVPDGEENPVRFATPYSFKDELPYLEPEG